MLTRDLFLNPASTEILPKTTLDQIIKDFQTALREHNSVLIKTMWNENPQLQAWFSGKQVNFAIPPRTDMRNMSINESIRIFYLVLASHSTDIIKAMWDGNPELQAWFSGKQVKFSREKTLDWRKIPTDDALTAFNYALASRVKEVVKAMWEGNLELQAWFKGKDVNFGTEKIPDWRKISNQDVINSYSSVLATQSKEVIEAMWLENPLIQTWYSGETVNFGSKKQPDEQMISTEDALINLHFALASHAKDVSKRMWKGNPQLQVWFSGKQVNFGTKKTPDWRRISIADAIDSFISALGALANHAKKIIKAMWEGNPQLQAWFTDQQVNFGTKKTPDWRRITIDDAISSFKLILATQRQDLIREIWNGNASLQRALKDTTKSHSKLILHSVLNSSSSLGTSDFIAEYIKEISNIELLRTVLKEIKESLKSEDFNEDEMNKCKKNQIKILENRLWELGSSEPDISDNPSTMPINEEIHTGSTNSISKKRKLADSNSHIYEPFKKQMKETINSFVKNFPLFNELGGLNYFIVDQKTGKRLKNLSYILLKNMAIRSATKVKNQPQYKIVISNIDKYQQLKKEHSQQVIPESMISETLLNENIAKEDNNFVAPQSLTSNAINNNDKPDIPTITIKNDINSFNLALANHSKEVIERMWEGNPQLQAWFTDQQVNFGTKETPDWRRITIDDAISSFKLILATQRQDLIERIWNGNASLQRALKDTTKSNSKLILQSVLNSSSNGEGDFITQYVKGISDEELLITVLKEIQENLESNEFTLYKKNQIEILERRLWELESLEQETSESDTVNAGNENEISIESSTMISKKRKLAASGYHSNKKFKKHTEEIISSFVASFPLSNELGGQNYFSVEQEMGERLQKLSKFMMIHMGIESVAKVGDQPQYKIVIADLTKYKQLKEEHSQQVTPESPVSAEPLNENTPETSNDFVFPPSPIANVISNNLAELELNPSTQNDNSQKSVAESLMSVELDNAQKEGDFEKEDDFVLLPSPILNAINFSDLELDYLTASNQVEDVPSTTDNTEVLASPVSPIARVPSAFVPVMLSNPINFIPLPPTSSATLYVQHNVLSIESSPVSSAVAAYEEENLNFNENNNEVAVTQATTINDIISRFNFALANNSTRVIKSIIWNKNPQLQAWYSGKKVNFGTEEAPDWRRISISDVIGTFNLVLVKPVKEIIKAMWEGNPQLQEWLAGNPINFSNTELSDFQAISIYDLIITFKSVLATKCISIIKVMWEGNPLLQQWFFGEQVNFGTEEFPDLRTILLDDALNNFKLILSSRDKYLIKAMWNNNLPLRAWLCGKQVDFDNTGTPDLRTIAIDDAINNFKAVLTSKCGKVVKAMWHENSLLQCAAKDSPHAKFMLQSVLNNDYAGTSKFSKLYLEGIDDEELIKTVLEEIKISNQSQDSRNSKKNKIELLEKRLAELTVTTETDEEINILTNVLSDFKSALKSRYRDIIKTMWNNNPQLQAWLSSEQVNFGTEEMPNWRKIDLEDAMSNFKSILAGGCKEVIKAVWQKNLTLQAWFTGEQINFHTKGTSEWRRIDLEDAINIFKSVLASNCEEVIRDIWTRNLWLQQGIKNNISIAKLMLQKVLSSNNNGKSDFIVQYIKDINDKKLLKTVLKEINGNPKGKDSDHLKGDRYRKNRIDILERRIHELESSGFDQESSDSDADISSMQSMDSEEMSTVSGKNFEKQTEEAMSSLIENFPASDKLLGESKDFFMVDQKIGEQLKKLSGIRLKNMAIRSVIKVRNQQRYKVTISDLVKYNQLRTKEDNRFGKDNNFVQPPSPMINVLSERLFDLELNNYTSNNPFTLFAHRNNLQNESSPDSRDVTAYEENLDPNEDDNDIEDQLSPSTLTLF